MTEPTQEQGQFLQSLIKSYDDFQGLGIQNYETFTKKVWKREQPNAVIRIDKPRIFHTNLAPIRALFGANRSFKSTASVAEMVFHLTGRYPVWYPEKGKTKLPVPARILVSDYRHGCGDVIAPLLNKFIPKSDIEKIVYHPQLNVPIEYRLKNKSNCQILTHEQDTEVARGWRGKCLMADEPLPQELWIENLRGVLPHGGRVWIACTLLSHFWIYDDIYTNSSSDIWKIEAEMADNPYNKPQDIEMFERNIPYEQRMVRIYGKPQFLMGLVFKIFSHDIHIIKPIDITGNNFTRYMSIDPHSRRPSFISWFAFDGKTHYLYDEVEVDSSSFKGIVKAIKEKECSYKDKDGKVPEISLRIIDPRFCKQPGDSLDTVELEFIQSSNDINYPISFISNVDSDISRGHMKIQEMLYYDITKPIDAFNRPMFYIFNTCHTAIRAFSHYGHKRDKLGIDRERIRVEEKYKDPIDTCRYYFMSNPQHYNLPSQDGKFTIDQIIGDRGGGKKKGMITGYNR